MRLLTSQSVGRVGIHPRSVQFGVRKPFCLASAGPFKSLTVTCAKMAEKWTMAVGESNYPPRSSAAGGAMSG